MNSRDVTRALRREALPVLFDAGFPTKSARTLHRHTDWSVDVVTIRSAGTHSAETVGCTPHSFSVFLGTQPTYVPSQFHQFYVNSDGRFTPSESACSFRRRLESQVGQPEFDDLSGWFIGPSGEMFDECIYDVTRALREEALPWFNLGRDPVALLEILSHEEEAGPTFFGHGPLGSPIRLYLTAYVARHLERADLATECAQRVLASKCFEALESQIHRDFGIAADRL